jgi:hypothetical protein
MKGVNDMSNSIKITKSNQEKIKMAKDTAQVEFAKMEKYPFNTRIQFLT